MSAALESRYRFLLRAYPANYRDARGSEMLDTLTAGAPETQAWPRPREAASLLLGGVRLRLAGPPRSARQTWYDGVQLAVIAWLLSEPSRLLYTVGIGHFPDDFPWPWVASSTVAAGAAVLVAARRPRVALAAFAAAQVLLAVLSPPGPGIGLDLDIAAAFKTVLIVFCLLLLQGRCMHASRSATLLRGSLLAAAPWATFGFLDQRWMLAVLALVLIWAALDAAVTVAVSLFVTAAYLQSALFVGAVGLVVISLAVGAVAVAVAVLQTRRLARL